MPRIEQKVAAELENIDNALLLIPDDIRSLKKDALNDGLSPF
jgi:hypothetical protein